MTSVAIRGGRVIDPASGLDAAADVLVEGGVIAEIGRRVDGDDVLDARGCIVAPGFVDLHTHVREPGREDEETIATASAAAAAGGYTAICAMPNTDPVADCAAVVEKVWAIGRDLGLVDVVPAGALTRGRAGEEMAGLGEMVHSAARVRLFTDDGRGVQDALLARRAMEYLVSFGAVYAEHCEVEALARGGHMHEGERSAALGLRGIPAEAEELMAARDVALARLTGCRLHILHASTAGTMEIVAAAKSVGVAVTCEAAPHHFSLTDAALETYDPAAKVNPPLRTDDDVAAVVAGLGDGTVDAIATDHAPHAREEKDQEFENAPPGIVGLETALGIAVSELVAPGRISVNRLVDLMSTRPARILGLDGHGGPLRPGAAANLVVFDPEVRWTVEPAEFRSLGRNTPFSRRTLAGRAVHTIHDGRVTVRAGAVVPAEAGAR